jgi:pantoate--beta-alanine ligase
MLNKYMAPLFQPKRIHFKESSMEIFHDMNAWRAVRQARSPERTIGFVPTMGHLHQGHLSLIERSQTENADTIVSVFVNKTQFNQVSDFDHYPRTLDADLEKLEHAGVRYCLIPTHKAIYPDDFHYQVHEISNHLQLEGKHRPGHFTGVLTVVMKLFHLVMPQRAYFGEKDYEQFRLIQNMAHAFLMAIDVIACPTLREASGLAYSSRNSRLSKTAREKAEQFAHIFQSHGSCEDAQMALRALGIDVEYLEEHDGRRLAAVHIEGVRLIDNCSIEHLRSPQQTPPLPSLSTA